MSRERELLAPGITRPGGVWADVGSGIGYFTLALCQLLGPSAEIFSLDKNSRALEKQKRGLGKLVPEAHVHYIATDFTQRLDLPPLDGIVMANALHYVRLEQQERVLAAIASHLKPEGVFILVEYEVRFGNPWVPYPVNYSSFEYLASEAGLRDVRRIAAMPSSFMREMYSALGVRSAQA